MFIVLVNDCGISSIPNQITNTHTTTYSKKHAPKKLHLKYVDDLSELEAINLKQQLIADDNRSRPDNFRARTGHILPPEKSKTHQMIQNINYYANINQMKLNLQKTKLMLFNVSTTRDFEPIIEVDGTYLQLVEETKLLGVHLTSDMRWEIHNNNICKKAYSRMWILGRLAEIGATADTLMDTYFKQVRTILEYCVPVWHPGLTKSQSDQLERVQNISMRLILGEKYTSSKRARKTLKLDTLNLRRRDICLKFGLKAQQHPNHTNWFQTNENFNKNRRIPQTKLKEVFCRTERYKNSTIPYLT